MTVTEASRNFADIVNRTYYKGDSTTLIRSGEPVARLVPISDGNILGGDWLRMWLELPHLDREDADDFAKCVESSRANLSAPESPWD